MLRSRVNELSMEPKAVVAVTSWPGSNLSDGPIGVSVLIPCFHSRPFLADALESIEQQRGLPDNLGIEVVLVSDGQSADATYIRELIAGRQPAYRFTVVLIELCQNFGAGLARYHGWLRCRGELVAFLDDDDVWHPDKLAVQVDLHLRYPKQIASGHGYEAGSRPLEAPAPVVGSRTPRKVSFAELLTRSKPATPTLMFCRALWPSGPEPFRLGEDSLMTLMIAHQQPLFYLPLVLAGRSPNAPPVLLDPHSLSRRRWHNRLAQWRNHFLLVRRGKLSQLWLPLLLVWTIALAARRLMLDVCSLWSAQRRGPKGRRTSSSLLIE